MCRGLACERETELFIDIPTRQTIVLINYAPRDLFERQTSEASGQELDRNAAVSLLS